MGGPRAVGAQAACALASGVDWGRRGATPWRSAGERRVAGHVCLVMLILSFFLLVIMDKYQEQPHLLDPHLGKNRG